MDNSSRQIDGRNEQRHIKALGLVDSDKKMCFMFSL